MSDEAGDWPWSELGLTEPGPFDQRAIKRAYARRLKERDWNADPAGFGRLRDAYEAALAICGEVPRSRSHASRSVAAPPVASRPGGDAPRSRRDPPPGDDPEARDQATVVPPLDTPPAALAEADTAPPDTALPRDGTDALREGALEDAPEGRGPAPDNGVDEDDWVDDDDIDWLRQPDTFDGEGADFLQRARDALADRRLNLDDWRAMMTDPALDDPAVKLALERMVVAHIARPSPWPPSEGWLRLIDRTFSWSVDGIGFMRRHPGEHHAFDLVHKSRPPAPAAEIDEEKALTYGGVFALAVFVAFGLRILAKTAESSGPAGPFFASVIAVMTNMLTIAVVILVVIFPVGLALLWTIKGLASLIPPVHRQLPRLGRWWRRPVRGRTKERWIFLAVCTFSLIAAVAVEVLPSPG